MSDNKQMQNTENTNEWINWIEEAVDKEHLNHYEYNQFTNIQVIGSGSFGKVYRANWKNTKKQLALKTFFNLNHVTMKDIVCELKIQRKVDFHDNIIRCHGITKFESENQIGNNNYIMVMEYADGGSLRNYLEKNFSRLTRDDKLDMAYQLAYAVSCLHNEGRDLHSGNILSIIQFPI
ncbi:kinase-like domain-containing protein [Rhizophagus diaphanus]|nr:kinase-like domain-containing protein [Rhizophagus diaphanus] [Rhizophagus sp. MUCL 43196]